MTPTERARRHAFAQQQASAKHRGVAWQLSFDEWLTAWGDRLDQRGRGRGQCSLVRIDETKAFTRGNVKVVARGIATRPASVRIRMQERAIDRITLLGKKEVATRLGVSPDTINSWRRQGRFPTPVRLGHNSVRWRLTDIDLWVIERIRRHAG